MKKRSIIWKTERSDLQILVEKSKTFTDILNYFGLQNKGNNTVTLRRRLVEDKIDFSHIPTGRFASRGISRGGVKKIPMSEILVKDSTYPRGHLKKRLIEDGLLDYKCSCGITDKWKRKNLVLVLDHINGVSNDNRLENLSFLCPNCNSQTETFAGRNIKY